MWAPEASEPLWQLRSHFGSFGAGSHGALEIAAPKPLRSHCALEIAAPKPLRSHCAFEIAARACPEPQDRSTCYPEMLFKEAVRRCWSKRLCSASLRSGALRSASPCSVHLYARVYTSIYIYIYSRFSTKIHLKAAKRSQPLPLLVLELL